MGKFGFTRCLCTMASSSDKGIKAFFTSFAVAKESADAKSSSVDSVLEKGKGKRGKGGRAFRLDWLNKYP